MIAKYCSPMGPIKAIEKADKTKQVMNYNFLGTSLNSLGMITTEERYATA